MKKSLVALAAIAVATAASAQSSVTLFGVVDVGISHYSTKSEWYNRTANPFLVPAITDPTSVKRSQTALSSGALATSRIGFRGTEDLGGGLSASFWLEAGTRPDDGSAAIANFARRSTVSLSSSTFGELRLGRDYTPSFWNDTVFDPLGGVGVGISAVNQIFQNLYTQRGTTSALNPAPAVALGGSDSYVRTSNSIGYFLPPNLGGIYGQLQYALHENVDQDGRPNSSKGRYVGGRLGYAAGPVDVAIAIGESTQGDFAAVNALGVPTGVIANNKIRNSNIGASYDFGVVKLFGEVSWARDSRDTNGVLLGLPTIIETNDKYTGGLLGFTVPVGPGLIRAAYSRVKYKPDTPTFVGLFGTDDNATTSKFALSYVHNLSKRTALYGTVAKVRIKNGELNPLVMGLGTAGTTTAATFASTGTGIGSAGYAPRSSTGYEIGLRHAF